MAYLCKCTNIFLTDMQARHNDRRLYFDELALTAGRHFMPYTDKWSGAGPGVRVLEIGCNFFSTSCWYVLRLPTDCGQR